MAAGSAQTRTQLNVQTFPRPPLVERCNRHLQVMWHGALIADCPADEAYWVLEAHHPPSASTPPFHPSNLASTLSPSPFLPSFSISAPYPDPESRRWDGETDGSWISILHLVSLFSIPALHACRLAVRCVDHSTPRDCGECG